MALPRYSRFGDGLLTPQISDFPVLSYPYSVNVCCVTTYGKRPYSNRRIRKPRSKKDLCNSRLSHLTLPCVRLASLQGDLVHTSFVAYQRGRLVQQEFGTTFVVGLSPHRIDQVCVMTSRSTFGLLATRRMSLYRDERSIKS